MFDFFRVLGFSAQPTGGSEYRFTYDESVGAIPLARLGRKKLSHHTIHSTWGNKYEGPALDAMKKTLGGMGLTYELILEFHDV
ncbi:hypothetical protein IMZ48_08830 [Candidatus Bathyarchaeota archaeon]|nr:hypothetical protein [Candidatus Bathyarchaeota archaeon]